MSLREQIDSNIRHRGMTHEFSMVRMRCQVRRTMVLGEEDLRARVENKYSGGPGTGDDADVWIYLKES